MASGFMGEANIRRLPVYLVLDRSGSMQGDAIAAVNEGVQMLYRELRGNPRAVETVAINIITFADDARAYGFAPVTDEPPQLSASGQTAMGAAFRAVIESVKHDLRPNNGEVKGDYKPIVFLLTDGAPTDEWQAQASSLRALNHDERDPRRELWPIVALGCGSQVNTQMLKVVTDRVYLMHDMDPETIRSFFNWVSRSVTQVSNFVGSVAMPGAGQTMRIPELHVDGIDYTP